MQVSHCVLQCSQVLATTDSCFVGRLPLCLFECTARCVQQRLQSVQESPAYLGGTSSSEHVPCELPQEPPRYTGYARSISEHAHCCALQRASLLLCGAVTVWLCGYVAVAVAVAVTVSM